MLSVLSGWYKYYFADSEAIILTIFLFLGLIVLLTMGNILQPLLAAVVISYLLDWGVDRLTALRLPKVFSVLLVFLFFIGSLLFIFLALIPLLWNQMTSLINEGPNLISRLQEYLLLLPKKYPDLITEDQVQDVITVARNNIAPLGKLAISTTVSSIGTIISALIYLVIVPLIVFFLLYDKEKILNWSMSFMPNERGLLSKVWNEVNIQLGNYIRGKVAEIIIVGGCSYFVFLYFNLNYAALLSVLIGLSVLLPYVGAVVVTLPVAIVTLIQFGWGADTAYVLVAYLIIQTIDGNVLVPVLFSEAVNLHPLAIIVAILVFGGFWGIWGMFFSIPLAILLKAVLECWPVSHS